MPSKKRVSLLQQQREKLKNQRALATTPRAKALVNQQIKKVDVQIVDAQKKLPGKPASKALPPAKPKALPSKSSAKTKPSGTPSARRAYAASKAERAAQGTKSSGVRTGEPKGASNRYYGAKRVSKAVRRAQLSTAVRSAASTTKSLAAQSAGIHLAGKLAETIGKKGQSRMSGLGIQGPAKPVSKKTDKPKTTTTSKKLPTTAVTKTVKKSRDYQAEKKAASKPIPPSKPIPAPKAKPVAQTVKERAYAADARNKEYDRLRKAGKIKEAEKLGKQIAADTRKKAPKNPFRAPQGAERKDRLSKQVQELKAMGKKKKEETNKQSAANKAGWQGNRNY